MTRLEPTDVTFFTSPEELRAWLEEHHATATEKWVGSYRKATGRPTVTWEQLVDEVLCYGWIDSVRMPYGEGRAQRITPRREGSIWSARNVGRVEALRAEGRMRPAGEAAYARRREDRTAIYSFERTDVTLDEEAAAAIRAHAGAWEWWEAQSNSYRRSGSVWVMSAKKPETRAKRLAALVEGCARRERLVELTGRPRPKEPPDRDG